MNVDVLERLDCAVDVAGFDESFMKIVQNIPMNWNLEMLVEDEQYRKLPSLLLKAVNFYEKQNRIPHLSYFKTTKMFYTQNPTATLHSKSNEWVLALLEKLERRFGTEEIVTRALAAGFQIYNDQIPRNITQVISDPKQLKWYSMSTNEITRLLMHLKCSTNLQSSSADVKILLPDLRRVVNLFSSPKRENVEILLNSFPTEFFEANETDE